MGKPKGLDWTPARAQGEGMKCLSCKHLTVIDDPGGGEETGPGYCAVSCGLGRWYLGAPSQLTIDDLRHAVTRAETCDKCEETES